VHDILDEIYKNMFVFVLSPVEEIRNNIINNYIII